MPLGLWLLDAGGATRTLLQRLARWCLRRPFKACAIVLLGVVGVGFYHALPSPLFRSPRCTVLTDRNGRLLAATIASDGQYRFAPTDSVPWRFAQCITTYEDRYFYWHMGVNPISVAKAAYSNLKARRIVRGGSTLTMQVARMMHPQAPRTLKNKLVEAVWALRLECGMSKEQILSLYASHAPFGSNVVGLEAAAWRYYGSSPWQLSWGEMAALAVLPNEPGSIFPGARSEAFRRKRDQLLHRLLEQQIIDTTTYELALNEPLPRPAERLPQRALHLLTHAIQDGLQGRTIATTIDLDLQARVETIVERQGEVLAGNKTYNAGVLVADVESGEVLAYVGNVPGLNSANEGYVNTVLGLRSSGSILKPILYAGMLDDGILLPQELIPDIPTKIGSFAPENSDHSYNGAVPASQALARSLNIPSVRMLRRYGVKTFQDLLHRVGFSSFTRPADHYGLSLILGGGECSLWETVGVYASLARIATRFASHGSYFEDNVHGLLYRRTGGQHRPSEVATDHTPLGAGAVYLTLNALREVYRPEEEAGWHHFSSSRAVAWKTGTSYGARDAWAVGVNRQYAVGVWVGNATGRGQTGISGVGSAAPIMFQIWGTLPTSRWFDAPLDDLARIPVCHESGFPPNPYCEHVDTVLIPERNTTHKPCPYHTLVHLDASERWRVSTSCYSVQEMHSKSFFALPPAMAWFYSQKHGTYQAIPPWMPGCNDESAQPNIQFIYPRANETLLSVPRNMNGQPTRITFEVAHRQRESTLYWHLDGSYVGQSVHVHQLSLQPSEGAHTLTVMDQDGNSRSIAFSIVYKAAER